MSSSKFIRGGHGPLGTSLWSAPTGKSRACKRCGGAIFWKITRKGKFMPVDADGRPHPKDCAKGKKKSAGAKRTPPASTEKSGGLSESGG